MQARPSQISEFFNGTKQMLVPLFQRPYEWGPKEWDVLWQDLLEQYEQDGAASHFTGAIVTAPARSTPIGVAKFLVIDGQQRLTTVAIIMCAIRTYLNPDSPKYRKMTRLLVNEDDDGLDHFKLLPTQPDRAAYEALIRQEPTPGTRFTQALEHFRKKLSGTDSDGQLIELDRMADTVQSKMIVVAIHLDESDDPYLIFESLNAKGAPLTQADLIRNYLLLRLHSNQQQTEYENTWLPMQSLLVSDHLTEFMRQFLMLVGDEVARSSIYSVLKQRLVIVPDGNIAFELRRMQRASTLYAWMVGLIPCPEESINERLARLRRWDITTANPFILKLLERYSSENIQAADVAECLRTIESFAVRRAVCGVPTNQLKRIFLTIVRDFPVGNIAAWLSTTLAEGTSGRRWPRDEEFREALFKYRAYSPPMNRCRFILESIEEHHGHKEPATSENITIEHVMPQTMSDDWKTMLGSNAEVVHDKWIDLLGNLTLTAYNFELSNSSFSIKKQRLGDSHFSMNKWIAAQGEWTELEMSARMKVLADHAIQVWRRPMSP